MSVEKLADGSGYRVRWRDSQGRSRRRKVTLWRDAVALDGELKRKKAMGDLIAHERGAMRLEDFWELWWQQYALTHLSPTTRAAYAQQWRRHIKPRFGYTRMQDITREDVDHLTSSLQLAPSSVHHVLAILQGVLRRAVEWRYISVNPVVGASRPRLVKRRGRALTAPQVTAICEELPLHSRAIVQALAWTGLRPGELRGLRWEHMSAELIYVYAPKTNRERSVDFRDEARDTLLEWFVACGQPAPGALVFSGQDGRPWTAQGWRMWQRKVFAPAAMRAGLAGVVPYDLRHTFASHLIAEGHDVLYVARQLGHAPAVTLATYAHEFEEQRKSVLSECSLPTNTAEILSTRRRSSAGRALHS